MTRQRALIAQIVQNATTHMTAEQIFQAARAQMPNIAIGTVYRNLNLMAEEGELLRVPVDNQPDRFDKTVHPHDHMVCNQCGQVADFPAHDLLGMLSETSGVDVISYHLCVQYVCNTCREKEGA